MSLANLDKWDPEGPWWLMIADIGRTQQQWGIIMAGGIIVGSILLGVILRWG